MFDYIIKELDKMIEIASMSNDEYKDYHKKEYEHIYDDMESGYEEPIDTYASRLGELQSKLEMLRFEVKGAKRKDEI